MSDHHHAASSGSEPAGDTLLSLLHGVHRFQQEVFPGQQALFDGLATRQAPHTLFITCADSRISPGTITQQPPGSLFVLRNIGNIVPAHGEMLGGVSAAVEYAVTALEVRQIVVCGHSDCGAMKALLDPQRSGLDAMPTVRSWLRNAEAACAVSTALHPDAKGRDAVDRLVRHNVALQLDHLRTHPAVAARVAEGRLRLQGWIYEIATGTVQVLDNRTGRPRDLAEAIAALREGA